MRSYRFITPNTADAPKLARDHVVWLLEHAGCPVDTDTARLLVSEVVSNAHRHTTSTLVSLTTTIRPGRVHIEVYDTAPCPLPDPPEGPDLALCAEGGRGLWMLQQFAALWGYALHGGARPFGKTVWFDLLGGAR
ncbi:ATP-binding protein [Streptomyces aidingensis]|uniref:ATP-binding protein n=1 Tax=Streptomyces aidingensis TaxID=910347 RepID=UPI001587A691|nr:ATP-binding protein [Streptomyces aidingensis]